MRSNISLYTKMEFSSKTAHNFVAAEIPVDVIVTTESCN